MWEKIGLNKKGLEIGSYRLYAPSTFEKFSRKKIMPHIKDNTVNG